MLVIRRRAGECLLIGEGVEVEILDCTASQVKLGIRAPREVTVLRKEIFVTGQQNQISAQVASAETMNRLLDRLR